MSIGLSSLSSCLPQVARCLKDLPQRLQTHQLTVRRKIFQVLSEGRYSKYCQKEGIPGTVERKVLQVLSGGRYSRYC